MESAGVNAQPPSPKPKVVFVLGATATGKSKLAIALAKRFGGEIINSDKIQVYDGVPILSNKVTEEERAGVPHHLLGGVHPNADFTAEDFRREAAQAVARVLSAGRLPVVAGGSNRYIEALVEGNGADFRAAHDCLFLWVNAAPELLEWYIALRVDDMVQRGLVDEARAEFDAGADYSLGVRRAIGLPEMHAYLHAEREGGASKAELDDMLERAVREIKDNTFRLALAQIQKIDRLSTLDGWEVRRVDVTAVFARMAEGVCHKETWETVVWKPCEEMVRLFLDLEDPFCVPAAAADVGNGDAILPAVEVLVLETVDENDGGTDEDDVHGYGAAGAGNSGGDGGDAGVPEAAAEAADEAV